MLVHQVASGLAHTQEKSCCREQDDEKSSSSVRYVFDYTTSEDWDVVVYYEDDGVEFSAFRVWDPTNCTWVIDVVEE